MTVIITVPGRKLVYVTRTIAPRRGPAAIYVLEWNSLCMITTAEEGDPAVSAFAVSGVALAAKRVPTNNGPTIGLPTVSFFLSEQTFVSKVCFETDSFQVLQGMCRQILG